MADKNQVLWGCRQSLWIAQTAPGWARDRPGQRWSENPQFLTPFCLNQRMKTGGQFTKSAHKHVL